MKLVIKKIKRENLQILQSEVFKFIGHKVAHSANCNDYTNYCNDIIVIDLAQSMFYAFRDKIESHKPFLNLALTPSEAVILLYCCTWDRKERSEEERFVMQFICDVLHEKLINI
jgi:hypothetical protein